AGGERSRFAEVAPQADGAHVVVLFAEASKDGEGPVFGAVVYKHRLPPPRQWIEGGAELVQEEAQAGRFVVQRDHDREHAVSVFQVSSLKSWGEALDAVLERARPLPVDRVALEEAAWRVLAASARAVCDLPPFPSSAMDGFAVRGADTPGTLPVAFRVAAGRPAPRPLEPGEAMGIATGGVVPDGADAVVPIEVVVDHDNSIEIPDSVKVGANVRPRGGDVTAGAPVVDAGERLGPTQIGALAAAGVAEVECARRPRVCVLTTGTELKRPGETLGPGEIYEANGPMLAALLGRTGGKVERLAAVSDDESAHRAALERGLEADVLVTSGGVSVGPHDLVRRVAAELGVEEVFWGVSVKPGKPLAFGVRG